MNVEDHNDKKKPLLPEALFPSIGNGLLWEDGAQEKVLRNIDPTISLDDHILDDKTRSSIVTKWIHGKNKEEETPDTKGKKIPVVRKTEDVKPDWLEDMEKDLGEAEVADSPVMESREEVKNQEEIQPEGKRVKKALKTAQKAAKAKEAGKSIGPEKASSLSPYTAWLKSLRGSEYVHPFDDDFALEQMGQPHNEGISETLADLLASQGLKDQAIEMYTLLMAKFPEKSGFFAAKIEALK